MEEKSNLKWDKEYATNYLKELRFLETNGVRLCFTKCDEAGLKTFKFEKTPRLFELLMEFYSK